MHHLTFQVKCASKMRQGKETETYLKNSRLSKDFATRDAE